MADATTTQGLRDLLAKYRAAETAVLLGQSYSLGGKTVTRADLNAIRSGISDLENRIAVRTRKNRASVVLVRQ